MSATPAPPAVEPDVPEDLPKLEPHGTDAVAAAEVAGDAAAAGHTCTRCEECPQCLPLHQAQTRAGAALSDLQTSSDAALAALRRTHRAILEAWGRTLAAASNRWAMWGLAWSSANSTLQDLLAESPWLATGAGIDPAKFSLTPRDGWIAYEAGTGVTLWVASEELLEEAAAMASTLAQVVSFQALQAEVQRLWDETMDAKARFEATERAHDTAVATAEAHWNTQTRAMRDALAQWEREYKMYEARYLACVERCRRGEEEPEDPAIRIGQFLGPVLGGAAAVAGALLVIAGQPFATAAVTQPGVVASAQPSASPSPASSPTPVLVLPDATTDQAMLDTWATGLEIGTAFPGTDWTSIFPSDLSGKFGWTQQQTTYRTSFFADPLEDPAGVLGTPVPVVGSDVTHFTLVAPGSDPVGDVLSWYEPDADLVVPPQSAVASDGLLATSVKFLGDVLDPAFCSGRAFQHVVVVNDPAAGPTFAASSSFPGDYYQGGNRFLGVEYRDCEPGPYLQEWDGSGFPALPFPGGHLVTTVPGVGTAMTMLLPDSVAPPGSSIRQVVFEVPTGAPFQPDNTRYQSIPDLPTGLVGMDGWTTTADYDFSLPDPGATDDGNGGTPTAPSPGPSVDTGGGVPPPDDGTDTGGGGTDGGGTDTGADGTDSAGGTEVGSDPTDPTDPGLVATGLGLAGLGGALLAGSGARRREDDVVPATRRTMGGPGRQPIPPAPADGGGGTRQPIPTAPPDGGGGTRQPIPPGPGGGPRPPGPRTAPYEPRPGEERPATRGPALPNAPAAGSATAPTPMPARPGTAPGTRTPMGGPTSPDAPAPPAPVEGPTTTLPGAAALASARQREAEAREAARQEALSVARTNVAAAERAYQSAVARRAAREGAEANEGVLESITDWYSDRDEVEDRLLRSALQAEEEAYDALRRALSEYATLEVLLAEASRRREALQRFNSHAPDARRLGSEARAAVESVIARDEDDRVRIQTLATQRARLRTAQAWGEAHALASNRLDPAGIVDTLDRLAGSIRDTRRQRTREWEETDAQYDAREWLRDTRRDLRVETAITLAERGTVLDPRDGSRVAGPLRQRFAADRLSWMADYLEASAWRREDPRSERATAIRERLKSAYEALDYLGHGDVPMSEYFLAVTVAVRQRQSQVNTWFVEDYLGLPSDDQGTWWDTVKVGWSAKAGTSGRVAGLGEHSLEVVRQRIHTMNVQADEAVRALETAARTPNPDDLPADTLSMLGRLGYLRSDADGTRHYQLPSTGDTTASRVTRIDRPGASWLDVVSVQNATEILASVALPELAAVRIAAVASRLGMSARAVTALRLLADQGLGLALDVGFQVANSEGRVDMATVALQSLAMSWTGMLGRGVVEAGIGRSMARLTASDETRALVVRALSEAFGVPMDAVQQLVFQSLQSTTGVTEEDLYAALLGSALNRYAARAGTGAATKAEHLLQRLPRGLRERSLVLTPAVTAAMRTDARLNEQAEAAFDRVLGGSAYDREAGTRVFEALRTGELSWSQLQRAYTLRGEAMATVMDQVRIDRDAFTQSVTSRARAEARRDVAEHYDARIADASSGAERTRLETEKQAELERIGDPEHEVRTAARFTSEGLEVAAATREELLDRIGGDEDLSSLTDAQLRTLALDQVTKRFEKVLGEPGDVIQPGSAGATSDIDRSWSSEFLRRAARRIILAEMTRGRIDGAMGPTTARAFDVNEYVNVMTRIGAIIGQRDAFSGVEVTVTVRGPDGTAAEATLSHADVVEANSFAAAMLHMDASQRRQFERNTVDAAPRTERDRLRTMFQHAHEELRSSAETLRRYTEEEAARLGTSVDDPDTQLRARDRLYGDRMAELDALGHRIDAAQEGSAERAELMSQWERLMNTALRDGIETYSDMANLDIIVIRLQSQKNPDGEKKTIPQLLRDPDLRTGALGHVSDQQLRSMLNDQVLMLVHHVHGYHHGHESAAKAVRSLAKYSERALLALGLLGRFDPDTTGPHTKLWEATQRLMKYKDEPDKLLRELAGVNRSTRGDVEQSLRWYLDQIETIPGMAGLTAPPPTDAPRSEFGSSVARRDWWRRREAAAERGATARFDATERHDAETEIARLTRVLERLRTLGQFRAQDRHTAERLLRELSELQVRWRWLSGEHNRYVGAHSRSIQREIWTRNQELERLREAGRGGGADAELARRIGVLEARLAGQRARLSALGAGVTPAGD